MKYRFIIVMAVLFAGLLCPSASATDVKWDFTSEGLPYLKYEVGTSSVDDLSYLIGNYKIKVNAHANGIYELISGERVWARFNADPSRPEYGSNRAVAYVDGREIPLAGEGSLAARPGKCDFYAGVGFVRYDYDLGGGLKCSRMISVMPSDKVNEGSPLFLVTVTFHNTGSGARKIAYDEAFSPCFIPASYQQIPEDERPLRYLVKTDISFRCITASFSPIPQKFVQFATPSARAIDEYAPQSVFLYCDKAFLVVNDGQLKASADEVRLRSGRKHTYTIAIGFAADDSKAMAESVIAKAEEGSFGVFASMWKKRLPDFSDERDMERRKAMYCSAHRVEASAVYSDYFNETYIPGSSDIAYRFGENVSNRDHINAALQACYTNPDLAKSIIRYVLKQTTFDGIVPDSNKGYGYIPSDAYKDNNIQLDVFNAIAIYLEKTSDYAFLEEWLTVYPMERGEMQSVMSILERYFLYLRNNPSLSSMRMAMQSACLDRFVAQMEKSGRASDLYLKALKEYAAKARAQFRPLDEYNLAEIPYLLESKSVTNSDKRDLLDRIISDDAADLRAVPGLSTFDGIEASALFRDSLQMIDMGNIPVKDAAWIVYCYYRLKE